MKSSVKFILITIVVCMFGLLTACGSGGSGKTFSNSSSSVSSIVSSKSSVESSSTSNSTVSSSASSVAGASFCGFSSSPVLIAVASVSRVEAENYDSCVTSFADTSENNSGGEYRQDSVDITTSQATSNNHYVSDMASAEYMEYSLDVEKSGLYTLTYRVLPNADESTAPAVLVLMAADGEQEETEVSLLPAINNEWMSVTRNNVYLHDGLQVLRLKVTKGDASLDYFEFSYTEDAMVTPHLAVAAMGIGINLGNTLDAPSEGAWAPAAQEHYLVAFQEAGFRHVRIPVTWDSHTAQNAPFEITQQRIDRVEQVVDWALAQGYYVILNAHHESWLKNNYTVSNKNRFDAIWRQIAERFKNKSSRLLFEILNEPHGMTTANVNELNSRVLNIIRQTNPTRLVVFAGNDYSGIATLLAVGVPEDNYLIGNFHSYDPWPFAGQCVRSWGSQQDINELGAIYQSAKQWSDQHNVPVMVNEFGVAHYDFTQPQNICNETARLAYLQTHVNLAIQHGLAATVWDDNGSFGIYNREFDSWGSEKDILVGANPQ